MAQVNFQYLSLLIPPDMKINIFMVLMAVCSLITPSFGQSKWDKSLAKVEAASYAKLILNIRVMCRCWKGLTKTGSNWKMKRGHRYIFRPACCIAVNPAMG
jgi:hypothetical protein